MRNLVSPSVGLRAGIGAGAMESRRNDCVRLCSASADAARSAAIFEF
jgi:hypothetical protein